MTNICQWIVDRIVARVQFLSVLALEKWPWGMRELLFFGYASLSHRHLGPTPCVYVPEIYAHKLIGSYVCMCIRRVALPLFLHDVNNVCCFFFWELAKDKCGD